ncbi:MAG: monovalent cation/H+ antiporter complex subunit F [Lacunisphaera sp.]|nr:monovalent cation/H+ antiporter complex subunit F [Lacunisphaera sp.]
MMHWFLILAVGLLLVAMVLGFWRLARGPTVVDRILAFDAVVLCAVGLTVVLSRVWHTDFYLELILIISSLGFFGTVAFVLFLQRALPYGGENDHPAGKEGADE